MNTTAKLKKTSGKWNNKKVAQDLININEIIHSLSKVPVSQRNFWLDCYMCYWGRKKGKLLMYRYLPRPLARKLANRIYLGKVWLGAIIEGGLLTNQEICREDKLHIGEIVLPIPNNDSDIIHFSEVIVDDLYPYLLEQFVPNEVIELATTYYGEGPYEYGNVRIAPGDVVIDAGASIGDFSALASVRRASEVYAFEPVPRNIDLYLSKTAKYNKGIKICEYALSDSAGEQTINVCGGVGGATAYLERNEDKRSEITVKTITLDSFVQHNNIARVDFIKADIEGAERYMLMGARQVLRDFAPKLAICTYHLPDDPKVLQEIILDANPNYVIEQGPKKMFAYVPSNTKGTEKGEGERCDIYSDADI